MAIKVVHTKVSTIPDGDDTSLIRPSDWNSDHTLTGLGTMAEQNANAVAITGGTMSGVAITGYIPSTEKGVANGVATLDSGGQVPLSQLPPLGDLNYQGAWNASTNTPTLTSSVGTKGYYYVVSVAGTTNLNGITDWQVGDWAVFNGSVWQKIDNTDAVTSVNGYTGTVVLTAADVGAQPVFTSQTANTVYAAPNGSAGVPSFRALVSADIPSLSGTYIPYTGASTSIDLNAQTVTNIAHLGLNSTAVPDILFRAYGDNNSTSRIAIRGYSSNASSSSMRIAKFRGTYAAPQAPLSGDSLGKFELAGYGTTSANGYPQASYEGVATENWGATARGAKALFYVTPNTTITQAVALTIDQDSKATFANTVTANGVLLTGNTGTVTSVAATAGTGISVSGSPITTSGTLTITNSAPDQTVVLTAGTGISTSGTYPNFTITNTAPSSGGTVTSVSGTTGRITSTGGTTPVIDLASGVATAGTTGSATLIPVVTIDTYGRVTSITTAANPQGTVTSVTGIAPVVSSGGATPAISMAAATGSVNGYLTSTDWTTFNNKTSNTGTVTSVGGTGTVNGLTLTGTVTTSGNLTLGGTLDLSSPPAIGGTAAAAITGTTITATKFVGVSGGTF